MTDERKETVEEVLAEMSVWVLDGEDGEPKFMSYYAARIKAAHAREITKKEQEIVETIKAMQALCAVKDREIDRLTKEGIK